MIRQRILDDAKTEEQKDILKRHLLTPLYSGDVVIAGQRDNTHSLIRRGSDVPQDKLYPTIHVEGASAFTTSTIPEDEPGAPQGTGTIAHRIHRLLASVMLHDKSHHRIVFAEVARTIEHVQSVKEVFKFAGQATTALDTMHGCGWVHRDISSGNILIVDDVVKLGDLEYTKKMDNENKHSTRSGTAFFMSIEAKTHEYEFVPLSDSNQPVQGYSWSTSTDVEDTSAACPQELLPFRYNPLHDLESLWWVLVYLLLRRHAEIAEDTSKRRDEQIMFYDQLFTDNNQIRQSMFQKPGKFRNGRTTLHSRMRPVGDWLEWARGLLVNRYVEVESRDVTKIDHTVGAQIASSLSAQSNAIAERFSGDKLDVKLSQLRPARLRDITPEQPGAAVAIGTSLDSRGEGSSKKRPFKQDVADSTTVHYQDLQEYAEKSKRAKLEEKEIQERQQRERNNLEVLSEEHPSESDAKGKGKAKEIPGRSDAESA
ncbi:hypothetical protein BDY19DRAFT_458366 [Irpex rosettiformis]|uniref:Uncharacterized protein n=1 Tax=Irpex rosettiformis TaxID=378272 RepID=A0ACB8TSZ8_9APHY|nr:hypothetical protein BDY19DRAFT_458366 [Irpex rosettiformis]